MVDSLSNATSVELACMKKKQKSLDQLMQEVMLGINMLSQKMEKGQKLLLQQIQQLGSQNLVPDLKESGERELEEIDDEEEVLKKETKEPNQPNTYCSWAMADDYDGCSYNDVLSDEVLDWKKEAKEDFTTFCTCRTFNRKLDHELEQEAGKKLRTDSVANCQVEQKQHDVSHSTYDHDHPGNGLKKFMLCDSVNTSYYHYQMKKGNEIKASRCCDIRNKSKLDLNILNLREFGAKEVTSSFSENQREDGNVITAAINEVSLPFEKISGKDIKKNYAAGLSMMSKHGNKSFSRRWSYFSLMSVNGGGVRAILKSLHLCQIERIGCGYKFAIKTRTSEVVLSVSLRFCFDPGGQDPSIDGESEKSEHGFDATVDYYMRLVEFEVPRLDIPVGNSCFFKKKLELFFESPEADCNLVKGVTEANLTFHCTSDNIYCFSFWESGVCMVQTPLHVSAGHNNVEIVKFLLNLQGPEKVELEARIMYGETPLHMVAKNGCCEAAKVLLANGSFVEAKANNGMISLHLVVWQSLYLMDRHTKPYTPAGLRGTHQASHNDKSAMVKWQENPLNERYVKECCRQLENAREDCILTTRLCILGSSWQFGAI